MTIMSPAAPPLPPEMDVAALARLGIVRIASEHFLVGPYRYARLNDAIAQATRGRNPDNDA
ncbi:MAG TPA: hypothetical protein VLK25_03365 [Allosphingosinicella sp.]|nr:hypothetical protein [Allosphingosinicella sp.]